MYALYRKLSNRWSVVIVLVEDEYMTIEYGYRWDPEYQIRRIK